VEFWMPRSLFDNLDYNLDREIAAFQQAVEDHKTTEGVPAPYARSPLVEAIVRNHGGVYRIIDEPAGRGPTMKLTLS